MSWFIYESIRNPEISERIQKEIKEVIGDGVTTQNSIGKLKFMEECWKETLRLYPPAPAGTFERFYVVEMKARRGCPQRSLRLENGRFLRG